MRQRPNGQPLDPEDMRQRLADHAADIADGARVTLETFIDAQSGDNSIAVEVALLEWEMDGVHHIFEKPKERLKGLAESTIHFFDHDCDDEDALDNSWRKHLDDLRRGSDLQLP